MKRVLSKYDFDYETVSPYFIDHVGSGKTLSKKIIEKIDFRSGKFYTFLPGNIRSNWLHKFSSGIILPIESNIIIGTDREGSEFINSFLQKSEDNCAIVEDYVMEACEYTGDFENTKMVPYSNEVYYLLNKSNSIDEIYQAVRIGQVWHTLIILTSLEDGDKIVSLNDEIIDKICDNAKYVIAGAYDGDAYIFWERSFDPQQLKLN